MGQYYRAVIANEGGKKEVFATYVDGEYMAAKLMEHSYWENPYVLAVASRLWRCKSRLAWVGDYAESNDFNWNEEFGDVYGADTCADKTLEYNGFRLEGKFFINHTAKEIIDLDKYKDILVKHNYDLVSPISLLTAVGNGKGGGDYLSGINDDLIGVWAWDSVEIVGFEICKDYYDAESKEWKYSYVDELADYNDVTTKYIFVED